MRFRGDWGEKTMRFREGDRVVLRDPDGKFDRVRGSWYPHGEIGGTILGIVHNSACVKWDFCVEESFADCGSWINLDYLDVERDNISIEINDSLSDFLVNA